MSIQSQESIESVQSMKEKHKKGIFHLPSIKKSKSLDNLHQYEASSSPDHSPKNERQSSLLSASPNSVFKFKGLKKKLHALKPSRSNSDITAQNASVSDTKKQHTGPIGSPRELGCAHSNSNNEMRKRSRVSDSNILNNGNMTYEQHGIQKLGSVDQAEWNSTRGSTDSSEHFLVVDTVGYDDSFEEGNNNYETDEVDGSSVVEHTSQEIERLLKKIDKTREELLRMQATMDENVKEYLKTADTTESACNIKTKTNFEKNNQKTNTSIQVLQKKLEKYQLQLKELEERGIHGPRRIIKVVQDSVRYGASSLTGVVSKPLESLNQLIKKDKKNSSTDNISITVTQNDSEDIEHNYFSNAHHYSNNSDDEVMLSSSCPSQSLSSSLQDTLVVDRKYHVYSETTEDRICKLETTNKDLLDVITTIKEQLESVVQSLQAERFKSEQLRSQMDDMFNQWNDLTELHQNEMMGLKQEMDRTAERIECVEYRTAERAGEIEESVDSCGTRITKMELQQHQQQQLLHSVDTYFGSGNTKFLLSKFLSLIISIFAILLVIISTLSKIVMPFASTRMRVVTTVASLTALVLLWRNSNHEFVQTLLYFTNEIFRPIYNHVQLTTNEMGTTETTTQTDS